MLTIVSPGGIWPRTLMIQYLSWRLAAVLPATGGQGHIFKNEPSFNWELSRALLASK